MRAVLSLAILLTIPTTASGAELTSADDAFLERLSLDPELRAKAIAKLQRPAETKSARKRRTIEARATATPTEVAALRLAANPNPEQSGCGGWSYLLRQDFEDFDLYECPGPAKKAAGAQISFTDDLAKGNRIWAVNGSAAVVYTSLKDPLEWWQPTYVNLGAYGSVNRVFNSGAAFSTSDVDKIGYGGFAQLGFLTTREFNNYFRLRGGGAEDHLKGISSTNVTFEYLPAYRPWNVHFPVPIGFGYSIRVDPSLFASYSSVTGDGQILALNSRTEAVRTGAQTAVRLQPYLNDNPLYATIIYRWSNEAYSGRNISWLQSTVTYNLDKDGFFAIGLTYKNGTDEDTGMFAHVYRLGLTGKI